jgi:hypothetical protein
MINKKDTAQMIDLMLNTDRLDPRADLFEEFPAFVLPPETHPAVTLQERGVVRKAHASFPARLRLFFFKDHGIDKNEAVGFRIARRNIHDRDSLCHSDLRRRDADTVRLAFHNTDQHGHKFEQWAVKRRNCLRFFSQDRIWKSPEGNGFHQNLERDAFQRFDLDLDL